MKKCGTCGALKERLLKSGDCRKCGTVGISGTGRDAKKTRSESKKEARANRSASKSKPSRARKEPARKAAPLERQRTPGDDPLIEYIKRVREVQTLQEELVDFVADHPEIVEQARSSLSQLSTLGADVLALPPGPPDPPRPPGHHEAG